MGYPPGNFLIAQVNPAGRPFHARLPKGHDKIISSNNDSSPFIVITPVRNEAGYIQRTIESMTAQTITPYKWIIGVLSANLSRRKKMQFFLREGCHGAYGAWHSRFKIDY